MSCRFIWIAQRIAFLLITAFLCMEHNIAYAQKTLKQKTQALFEAVQRNDTAAVRRLLKTGADANARDKNYGTPLFEATVQGNEQIAVLLLVHGAKVNDCSVGMTALSNASSRGFFPVVQKLLSYQANPNLRDGSGKTALHFASLGGYPSIVKALLAGNGAVNGADSQGDTPLLTCIREWASLNHFVYNEGSDVEQGRAVWRGELAWRMDQFMQQHQVGRVDETTIEKLSLKLQSDYKAVTLMLLKRGADVSVKNKQGETLQTHLKGKSGASIQKTLSDASDN